MGHLNLRGEELSHQELGSHIYAKEHITKFAIMTKL